MIMRGAYRGGGFARQLIRTQPLCVFGSRHKQAAISSRMFSEYKSPSQQRKDDEMDDLEKMAAKDLYSSPLTENYDEIDTDNLYDKAHILDPPSGSHQGTVIWLHSLGDQHDNVKQMWEMLAPSHLKIVAPRAPLIPITALEEQEERAWFDYQEATMREGLEEDYRLIELHTQQIQHLLDTETELVGSEKVVIAGFGQGAVMAVHAGLTYKKKLGGIVSFSGYLALPEVYPEILEGCPNNDIPILAIHGNSDEVVPIDFAKARYDELKMHGVKNILIREHFHLAHNTSEETLFGMQQWLTSTIT